MLKVCVARHDDAEAFIGPIEKRPTKLAVDRKQFGYGILGVQTYIGRDLVVAGTAGVQARARRTDVGDKPSLNRHMDVFIVHIECEGAFVHLALDMRNPPLDGRIVLVADDALRSEHLRMSQRSANILGIHRCIRRKRCAELLREGADAFLEPA